MNKRFRYFILLLGFIVFISSSLKFNLSFNYNFVFWSAVISAVIMDWSLLYVGEFNVEFTETITVFIYLFFGVYVAVVYEFIYTLLGFLIGYITGKREFNLLRYLFNVSMFTIITFISGRFVEILRYNIKLPYITMLIFSALTFDFIFLVLNILFLTIDKSLEQNKFFSFKNYDFPILSLNLIISTTLSVVLYVIHGAIGLVGLILVFGVLIIIHYALYLYNKINFKTSLIKRLLITTEDLIRHGDLKEKCDYLLLHLKEIIPYEIASLYFFDAKNEDVSYPISYYSNCELDIGDLSISLKNGITFNIIKKGDIYISKNIKKDGKIKITGKLLDSIDAAVFVPIKINSEVRGLIFVGGKSNLVDFLSQDINDILNILSSQMSLALLNYDYMLSIKKEAETDVLTGLGNRRLFDREIQNLVKLKNRFSLVIYDIDDFKNVNDTYGHIVGDEVLKHVSGIIKRSIRKTDIPCRYGGEELVILFKDLSKEDAFVISERIRRQIEASQLFVGNKIVRVTVSGGVASFPDDGHNAKEIIEKADLILYNECKNKGKNRVCIYPGIVQS
ncbi:sensor domain-containing diguanylate cyclase [Caloramator sp. ALD01]|uniref:sensor domain-containing diguanylate cyclase n=1 Tax=Caloramator sp. ALD01 TaxID=1031288 RepID=UPI0012EB2599|nr:sensor domain-containing diguanylate cyclase [Caloramator sp. ALD01]